MTNESVPSSVRPEPVASRKHSAVFVGIVALIVFAGSAAQSGRTTTALDANHPNVIPLYLSATLMNWLLVYFVWRGIRRRGLTLRSLIRGRWQSAREIIRDFALAALLWGLLWVVIWGLDRLPLPASTESLDAYLPRGVPEVTVWLLTCASAGFCEELVFRGYVQRQILALSGSAPLAILGQGIVFGLMHAYQGWVPVARITILGVLFGILATWRGTLRVGMIAHAWSDVWAGWLGRITSGA